MKKSKKKTTGIYEFEPSKWTELASGGTQNAISSLSNMVRTKIEITGINLKVIPASQAVDLTGGPGQEVVTVFTGIDGEASGHIMLVYPKLVAYGLIDMLMGYDHGTTSELHDMEISVLVEAGNMTGAFILNALADNTNMRLVPTPPFVMEDMATVVLDAAVSDIIHYSDDLFVMGTVFATEGRSISGTLLILPTKELMDVMMQHNGKFARVQW